MIYDAAIPLSRFLEADGTLDYQTKARMDHTIRRYHDGLVQALILTAGQAQSDVPFTHAGSMRTYALSQGVEDEHLLLEQRALDTVGQAIFTKRDIVEKRGMENLLITSSASHMVRVPILFSFVFGPKYSLTFEPVHVDNDFDPAVVAKERNGVETFLKTFEGVEPGNTEQIVERLFSAHPFYKGRAPNDPAPFRR